MRAWAQLCRLPNVITAIADPLAGWLIVKRQLTTDVLPAIGASACLYAGGIILNDYFDYTTDCRNRPDRPLPRGTITPRAAALAGAALLLAGFLIAPNQLLALALIAAILFYDAAWRSPVVLGVCRALNVMLGMPLLLWWPPLALGVYVTVLSFIARREELQPELRPVVKHLLLGIIVVDALMVLVTGYWPGTLVVLALIGPAWLLSRSLEMT